MIRDSARHRVEGVVISTTIAVALVALITLSSPVWAQNSSAASSRKSGLMTPEGLTSVPAQALEIASPRAAIWPRVESAIRSLIDGTLPPP